jgi:hypothetical protein
MIVELLVLAINWPLVKDTFIILEGFLCEEFLPPGPFVVLSVDYSLACYIYMSGC